MTQPMNLESALGIPCTECHAQTGQWCIPPYRPLHERRLLDYNHMLKLREALK